MLDERNMRPCSAEILLRWIEELCLSMWEGLIEARSTSLFRSSLGFRKNSLVFSPGNRYEMAQKKRDKCLLEIDLFARFSGAEPFS